MVLEGKWVDGWPEVLSSGADELQLPLCSTSGRRDDRKRTMDMNRHDWRSCHVKDWDA
jgi:hypothetical protein